MIAGLTTVHNCQQLLMNQWGGGDRFVEQMRVISTTTTKQISSFK